MMASRHTAAKVVTTALALLDERGWEAVTLRGIARRMGAHLNSVSFQVKTKSRLLELMTDQIMGELSFESLPDDPLERVREIYRRYRAVLLRHRDAARLMISTRVFEANTLLVGEAVVAALREAGVDDVAAVRAGWSMHYFVIGLVQEEQAMHAVWSTPHGSSVLDAYPALASVASVLEVDTYIDRMEFGISAILAAACAS